MSYMLNSIVTGMGRGSKLMLDNLGIVFDINKAYDDYAKTLNKTAAQLTDSEKKQAFINTALAVGKKNSEAAGTGAVSLGDKWEKIKAIASNLAIEVGSKLLPLFNKLADVSIVVADAIARWVGVSDGAAKSSSQLNKEIDNLNVQLALAEKAATSAAISEYRLSASHSDTYLSIIKLKDQIKELTAARDEAASKEAAILAGKTERERVAAEESAATMTKSRLDAELLRQEAFDSETAFILATEQQKIDMQIAANDKKLQVEENFAKRKELLKTGADLRELKREVSFDEARIKAKEKSQATDLKNQETFLNTAATLSNSKNKELAMIGKAAAITQIAIKTPPAVASSFEFGTKLGGPPLGFLFAGIAGAAMAAQAASIAGVPLAEGGIVRATPGGTQALIGEGGRDEAVIPLDSDEASGAIGNRITININGGMLGDESSARQFAIVLDKQLYNLRKSNESISFDEALV